MDQERREADAKKVGCIVGKLPAALSLVCVEPMCEEERIENPSPDYCWSLQLADATVLSICARYECHPLEKTRKESKAERHTVNRHCASAVSELLEGAFGS